MSERHPPEWTLFGRCGRCLTPAEQPCQRLDGGGEAKQRHAGRPLLDGTQRRSGRPILTSGGRRAQWPGWSLRVDEALSAAARAEAKRQRNVAAAERAAVGRCPLTPSGVNGQCTRDRSHQGDCGHVREHLPRGYAS